MFRATLLTVLALVVPTTTASAASSVTTGWWTSSPVAAAPDAPDDQLVVQGGPDPEQPLSYAAVAYALSADEVPRSLTLTVAESSASTPSATIAVCPLTDAFAPAQGGPMADAPRYDCAGAVTATVSEDGTSYEFGLEELAIEGDLALAVLPTTPTDRVVFEAPGTEALSSFTRAGTPTPASDPGEPSTGAAGDPALDSGGDVAVPDTGDSFDLPADTAEPGSDPVTDSTAVTTPIAAGASQAGDEEDDDDLSFVPPLVFVVLVAAAGLLWVVAGSTAGSERVAP